jgi:hypothetical protein
MIRPVSILKLIGCIVVCVSIVGFIFALQDAHEHRRAAQQSKLQIQLIIQAAEAYRKSHSGEFPSNISDLEKYYNNIRQHNENIKPFTQVEREYVCIIPQDKSSPWIIPLTINPRLHGEYVGSEIVLSWYSASGLRSLWNKYGLTPAIASETRL